MSNLPPRIDTSQTVASTVQKVVSTVSNSSAWPLHIVTLTAVTAIAVLAGTGHAVPEVLAAVAGGSLGAGAGISIPGKN